MISIYLRELMKDIDLTLGMATRTERRRALEDRLKFETQGVLSTIIEYGDWHSLSNLILDDVDEENRNEAEAIREGYPSEYELKRDLLAKKLKSGFEGMLQVFIDGRNSEFSALMDYLKVGTAIPDETWSSLAANSLDQENLTVLDMVCGECGESNLDNIRVGAGMKCGMCAYPEGPDGLVQGEE